MTKASLTVGACAVLFCAGAAFGIQTAQEKCDQARVTAWKTYVACIDTVLAKDAGCVPNQSCPTGFDEFAAFAKCRHTYFKNWTSFQGKKSLTGTTCIGSRFTSTDSAATVTDALTGLVWEVKTNDASVHDEGNTYSWSTGTNKEDGTAFTSFLGTVNGGGGFAGSNGWRLPTLAELETILLDFACKGAGGSSTCSCASHPCIEGTFGPTQSIGYWSATGYVPNPGDVWVVDFFGGRLYFPLPPLKTYDYYVRAVRSGL